MGGEDKTQDYPTQTSTPIIDIDRIPDYQYAGLPLGEIFSGGKFPQKTLFAQASTPITTAKAVNERAEELSIKIARSLGHSNTGTR